MSQLPASSPRPATESSISPPSKSVVLVSDCAREIKAVGCSIWLIQKPHYGFVLRCERGPAQFRVILPPLVGDPVEVPQEERTPTHIVTSIGNLRHWLQSLRTKNG